MTELERRYHRLLRAYPAEYRRARGAEIVGTYLDLAGPDRRWPSPADAADLLRGGLRQRLRAAGVSDLAPGGRLAAVLAFTVATMLAATWAVSEPHLLPAEWQMPSFGPFATVGVFAWVGWLLAAVVAAIAPGRWARIGVTVALVLTGALVPLAALTDLPRPPLFVLLPQVALGLVALALPDQPSAPVRYVPLIGAVVIALTVGLQAPQPLWNYGWGAVRILPATGALLLIVVVLVGVGLALRQDRRGLWAMLVLLTPAGLLCVGPLYRTIAALFGELEPWGGLVVTTVAVSLLGPAPLAAALLTGGRRRPAAPSTDSPACGTDL